MKEIEIPNDSEQKGFELTIPDGMEAIIKDGKVIFEKKENEDERIRQELLEVIKHCYEEGWYALCTNDYKKYSAYLEKPKEQKPAKWNEEDEIHLTNAILTAEKAWGMGSSTVKWLKSLRPQPKEEREPMEIKYGGKIYQVHGVRALPGGATSYIIEDEPGHYDCIMNPEEVFGGGYGVKQNGSPYPTKEATFDQPHWKPSKDEITAIEVAAKFLLAHTSDEQLRKNVISVFEHLKQL